MRSMRKCVFWCHPWVLVAATLKTLTTCQVKRLTVSKRTTICSSNHVSCTPSVLMQQAKIWLSVQFGIHQHPPTPLSCATLRAASLEPPLKSSLSLPYTALFHLAEKFYTRFRTPPRRYQV